MLFIMGHKESILKLLSDNKFTSKEIANYLNLSENAVRVYLNRLKKKKMIKVVDIKDRYMVYEKSTPDEESAQIIELKLLLAYLLKLMNHKYERKKNVNLSDEDLKILTKIRQLQEDAFWMHIPEIVETDKKRSLKFVEYLLRDILAIVDIREMANEPFNKAELKTIKKDIEKILRYFHKNFFLITNKLRKYYQELNQELKDVIPSEKKNYFNLKNINDFKSNLHDFCEEVQDIVINDKKDSLERRVKLFFKRM